MWNWMSNGYSNEEDLISKKSSMIISLLSVADTHELNLLAGAPRYMHGYLIKQACN